MQISEVGIRNMLSFEFCYLKEHSPARVLLAFFLQVLQPKIGILAATLKKKKKKLNKPKTFFFLVQKEKFTAIFAAVN